MTDPAPKPANPRSEPIRLCLMALGWVLLILGPLIGGPLPGPLGFIAFAAGMALLLKNSHWARMRYVRLKQRYPKIGYWTDKGLRRKPKPDRGAAAAD